MIRIYGLLMLLIYMQHASFANIDSNMVMHFEDYIGIIKNHHPMARRAELKVEIAERQYASAKGSFDPEINSSMSQKIYEGTEYYKLFGTSLKVPAWFGIEVYTGIDMSAGTYLNPERNLPENGLYYAGISLPLGQDLFIDYRMFELKKADIYLQASIYEKQVLMNELLMDASVVYWNWFKAYNALKVYEEIYATASIRFDAIKKSALGGDRPFIDTVEAHINLQNRYMGMLTARNDYENKTKQAATYLWAEGIVPLEITEKLSPPFYENIKVCLFEPDAMSAGDSLILNHPKIKMNDNKLDYLALEKRYRQEQLKPQIDLKYNFITEPFSAGTSSASFNNYTWGFEFSTPIFLMDERNALKVTKLQMEDNMLAGSLLLADLTYKNFMAANNWKNSADQLIVWQGVAKNYLELFEAEMALFNAGESSIFMINSREMDRINALLKWIDLIVQNQLAAQQYDYSLGLMGSK
ncbi:MAG: TolC family protein [Crocinitomicaceae bacterium]|nr:TolC family protein [Crocinitomicaceae bacterium]